MYTKDMYNLREIKTFLNIPQLSATQKEISEVMKDLLYYSRKKLIPILLIHTSHKKNEPM